MTAPRMRIGLNATGLVRKASIPAFVADAERAEADGFSSYWVAEHPTGGLDALTVLALVGQHVETMELGTAVVPTYPRHPVALAAQALTVQSAIRGRLTLGIGLSHQLMMADLGLEDDKPIRHLRDYLSILCPMIETGRVDHTGPSITGKAEIFQPQASPPGIVVAALGPQTLRVAGSRTAGTSLAWVGPRTIEKQIRPVLSQAAEAAGREAPRIIATLPICITDKPRCVREALAPTAANYQAMPSYRAMFEAEGVSDPTEVGLIGSADEIVDRLGQLADAGVTDFAASEFAPDIDDRAATRDFLRAQAGA